MERAEYMDCGFCDRLFGPDAAGQYEGITRVWGLLDPDDPDAGDSCAAVCDLCKAETTGRLVTGLAWPGERRVRAQE